MFHSQLTQFYVTQLQDFRLPYSPACRLPFWSSSTAPGCVSNSMMARKMPFIIFTSRANNKPWRLFHILRPTRPPSSHFAAFVVVFLVVFVLLWLIIIICAFYISVFYWSTFHIPAHTYRHTHTPRHSGTLAEKPYIFIDFIGYNKSHTQRQQLHLLSPTVVECVGLIHTLFCCQASGTRDLYTFITSRYQHSPFSSRNPRFKILSSSALLLKGRSVCLIVQAKILISFIS